MKLCIAFLLLLAACGGGGTSSPPDSGVVDPGSDAAVAAAPPDRADLVAGGRMTGGSLVVDVQIGHPHPAAPVTREAP